MYTSYCKINVFVKYWVDPCIVERLASDCIFRCSSDFMEVIYNVLELQGPSFSLHFFGVQVISWRLSTMLWSCNMRVSCCVLRHSSNFVDVIYNVSDL